MTTSNSVLSITLSDRLLSVQMMPTAMILFFSKFYTRHRTLLLGVTRLLEMFSTDAYLSFWMDYSDKGSCFEWSLLASVFANNWISAAHWCAAQISNQGCSKSLKEYFDFTSYRIANRV